MTNQIIDTSFARAARLMLAAQPVQIVMVGCGGTGSWLAPSIARLARVLSESDRKIKVVFVDHDEVEPVNIPRQNFYDAEIGQNKAIALATRYGQFWGLEIAAVPFRFDPVKARGSYNTLTIVVGCVDNAAARRSINEAAKWNNSKGAPRFWWLDCGNYADGGQVLLGSASTAAQLEAAFTTPKICTALPSPAMQNPDLLKARPEEAGKRMSCAELQAANLQSLTINQHAAAIAADYLTRMLTGGKLRICETNFNQDAQSSRSTAITPEAVAAMIKKPVEFVMKAKGATA